MITGPGSSGRDGGDNLQTAVDKFPASAWPTPTSRDWKDTGNLQNVPENFLLGRVAANWATPSVADTTGGRMARSGARSDEPLLKGQAANLMDRWPTPTLNGDYNRKGASPSSGDGLATAVNQWPTPTSLSYADSHQPGNSYSYNETVRLASFLPDPATYPVGGISSKERRSLNPLFVEWLMGWPPGWTLLAWTDFARSETALSAYRQRMRSALLQLGLPQAAPPAQIDLFA